MTEKQLYEWQILGNGSEFSQAVQRLGRDLVWLIARDGDGLIFKSSTVEDVLKGKIRAWSDPKRRQSKRLKDLADIARLVEAHPELWDSLNDELREKVEMP